MPVRRTNSTRPASISAREGNSELPSMSPGITPRFSGSYAMRLLKS